MQCVNVPARRRAMILGVNGIRLVGKISGVARATEALLNAFAEIDQPFDEFRVYSPEPLDPGIKLPAMAQNVVVPSRVPGAVWEQLVLPRANGARNVLLCPSYVLPVLARCPTLLIHHGSYEGYGGAGEVFSAWTRLKYRISYPASAWRATTLCTVSEHSRRDITRFYGVPTDRIHVVPEGVDTRLFAPVQDRQAACAWRRRVVGDESPFLLYVGKPTRRRNLPNLLHAFARLKTDRSIPHKLVLIGTSLPGTPFESLVRDLDLASDVVTVPHATHEEIALAYNACSIMIYPSDYEGFGMPVLEAMACGAPVIALDNTAFPEFAGGVAMLLPDAKIETLAAGTWDLLQDSARRARMLVEGPRRAAEYDWRAVARRYMDLLRQLAAA